MKSLMIPAAVVAAFALMIAALSPQTEATEPGVSPPYEILGDVVLFPDGATMPAELFPFSAAASTEDDWYINGGPNDEVCCIWRDVNNECWQEHQVLFPDGPKFTCTKDPWGTGECVFKVFLMGGHAEVVYEFDCEPGSSNGDNGGLEGVTVGGVKYIHVWDWKDKY